MSGYSRRQIGNWALYVVAAGVILIDQATKAMVRSLLSFGRTIDVIPGFFSLRMTNNTGGAFGIFSAWPQLLSIAGIIAVLLIIGLSREKSGAKSFALSLGLLLGGAVGNLIDRIRLGHVTDFLDMGIRLRGRTLSWPTFNFADIAITIGVVLLAYHLFFGDRNKWK